MSDLTSDILIRKGYLPGAIGRVVELHGRYYSKHWGFGLFFETKVARELSQFMDRYNNARDGFWTATVEGRVEGSITIDGADADGHGAHLRWFVVSEVLQGRGIGERLMQEAMDFCRNKGYGRVYLWTFEGLLAARRLYEKAGFQLVDQYKGCQWGTEVDEQRFELSR
jgi:GNAT superfamily N-acetyltransferase